MLDPRIFRTGLIIVALALVVAAFSLENEPGGLGTALPPIAFNGAVARAEMVNLARQFPDRAPGSAGDRGVAADIAAALDASGFAVSTPTFTAHAAAGKRTLENVIGERIGLAPGAIVILAGRDAAGSPATAGLSGTGVLLELAHVLSGETERHSIVLVSTSGTAGVAGASELARTLPRPIDAVIALGDLDGSGVREPIVVPWSSGDQLAPVMLRSTVGAAVQAQSGLRPGGTSFGAQLARLAFPIAPSAQGPFNAAGIPAVLLSLSGEHVPSASEPLAGPGRIGALGQAVLESVNALDAGPAVTAPSRYLLLNGEVLPDWAIRLLALALIVPMVLTVVDGLARARRRGEPVVLWVEWVLAAALPFLLAFALARLADLVGLIAAPPGALEGAAAPLRGGGIALLAVLALVVIGGTLARGRIAAIGRRAPLGSPRAGGAAVALVLVLTLLALVLWVEDPYAALLVLPALNLWPWAIDGERPMPRAVRALLFVIGLIPPVLVVLYDAGALSLTPPEVAWNGLLLFAGGGAATLATIEWCVLLGCLVSAISILIRIGAAPASLRQTSRTSSQARYSGPRPLGRTGSALRR